MKYIITENQLKKIIENDEKQSFFDKMRQKVSIFKPVELTDQIKFKMIEFVVDSLNKGDFQVEVDFPVLNTLTIHTNKKVLINGINSSVFCTISNLRNTLENKITKNVFISFHDVNHGQGNNNLGFLDKDNDLFNQLISNASELEKKFGKKDWKNRMKNTERNMRKSVPSPERVRDVYYFDDDDFDIFSSGKHHDDNGFKGFGGGQMGGGGAGGSW
jgi:hypothetical protein